MRLIRFGDKGQERPGIFLDGDRKDLSDFFHDWDSDFFNHDGLEKLSIFLGNLDPAALPDVPDDVRWGAPIARPGKIMCIGLNFSDHAAESGSEVPAEPLLFMKASTAFSGPYDHIVIPRSSTHTDWEVELGLVIGKDAHYVDEPERALDYVAGYVISNDVSEREYQKKHCGQWCKGKSCDTFNPVGPFLVTKDEIGDVNKLGMRLKVNGELRQDGNTATMIFKPHILVHYLSQFMTLEAGDLISTGTPPGVGMGMDPPSFLKEGDVLELEIDGLGSQRQDCVNWSAE